MSKAQIASITTAIIICTISSVCGQEPYVIPLANSSFDGAVSDKGIPSHWSQYGGGGENQKLEVTEIDGEPALLIADGCRKTEIGVSRKFPLKGGETYQVTANVRGVQGASTSGAYLQFRFLPSNTYVQRTLHARSTSKFSEVSVRGTAPPDTTHGVIYLYSHRDPIPQVLVAGVELKGGLPAPPPPPPEPVPPQYNKLKDLHLQIPLVRGNKANAAIVAPASDAYQTAAVSIQKAIEERTGVSLPILSDDSPEARVPLQQNLIVLGNRSTNKTINSLYDHYYCLADLKYPGPEGYVIRTVHNPYGNGNSAVVVGASDSVGVGKGADALAAIVAKMPVENGSLVIGWTMQTQLGKGVTPPTDIKEFETWEASRGYGSIGYFGWCSISKHMAMYYMTGNEASAREVVRLSFPDEQAIRDIEEIDGERIENKHDPLAGFYHYNAHMAILFWDLIEESPVFSNEERLKITNAFARQLNHRKGEGVYRLTMPPSCVGSRHGQWSAISLYCLGRYFNKDYPNPIWAQCVRGGELAFAPLHEYAWIAGESDNLFWYSTGIAPVFTYMTLTGDRELLENGVVGQLLRGQEALVSGRDGDWALRSASMGMLNKAAYVTGDGRWVHYRDRTGVDTDIFRLGQSFWPDETIPVQEPTDLVGKWTINPLPDPAWNSRGSGLPFEQSFYFGSYRSATDASGDFILLDGFNGASRNPYHTFDILQLRLAGHTVLDGYHNQVLTSADGMVEPAVAMNAALLHADVVGPTAIAVGEVPNAAFCNWRRSIAQRTGKYALVVDDLTFRTDSQNMSVATTWQMPGGRWDARTQAARASATELRSSDVQDVTGRGVVTMKWNGAVEKGGHRFAFYLIAQTPSEPPTALACVPVSDNAAALALHQTALAVTGKFEQTQAELAVLAEDHVNGHALTSAGVNARLISSSTPIDIDWDFQAGTIHIVVSEPTRMQLAVTDLGKTLIDGKSIASQPSPDTVHLDAGRYVITGASPRSETLAALKASLESLLADGQTKRARQLADAERTMKLVVTETPTTFSQSVGGKVADMICFNTAKGRQLAIAAGTTVQLLTPAGEVVRQMETDGPIRVLHWWNEAKLLLAGCTDEQVIAFDLAGARKWTFTSEMDQAVYEAAKTYWFKSAPGHEGIHGLYTGAFDDNKSRCFVGSACTLEILDESGKLVKRTPVFWGPGRKFLIVDGPDKSKNLLISRWLNGNDFLSIVNSRTMTASGRGYYSPPSGHSFVSGWSAQNRTGLFHTDLDGDGKPEVATTINGTWNRVTVYSEDGKPLHNAQFGPGPSSALRSRMRDMDIGDVDGDGKKKMLVGLAEGLVVCLNSTCEKVWSTRLPSPPLSLRCIEGGKSANVVVGCDNGTVVALDSKGTPRQIGQVTGRPTHMTVCDSAEGSIVVLATEKGEVKGFTVAQ